MPSPSNAVAHHTALELTQVQARGDLEKSQGRLGAVYFEDRPRLVRNVGMTRLSWACRWPRYGR